MKQAIDDVLDVVESKYGVRILHAVEGGSRAYGLEKADSDYDVRFIYVQPLGAYMNMWHSKDTIQNDFENLDVHGWDIQKALRLAERSNPSLIEWVNSSVVYRTSEFALELREIMTHNFTQSRLYNHYARMMNATMRREQLGVSPQNVRQLMRAFRAALCAAHVKQFNEVPPIKFDRLLKAFNFYPILLKEVEALQALLQSGIKDTTYTAEHTLKLMRDLAEQDRTELNLEWDRKPSRPELQKLFNHEVLHG